jgi:hypothetical protein
MVQTIEDENEDDDEHGHKHEREETRSHTLEIRTFSGYVEGTAAASASQPTSATSRYHAHIPPHSARSEFPP